MKIMPLYGFVQGDTMGLIILARLDGTVAELGDNMLRAAGVRIGRRGAHQIMAGDRALDPQVTLRMLPLNPLDRVDLVWREETTA